MATLHLPRTKVNTFLHSYHKCTSASSSSLSLCIQRWLLLSPTPTLQLRFNLQSYINSCNGCTCSEFNRICLSLSWCMCILLCWASDAGFTWVISISAHDASCFFFFFFFSQHPHSIPSLASKSITVHDEPFFPLASPSSYSSSRLDSLSH